MNKKWETAQAYAQALKSDKWMIATEKKVRITKGGNNFQRTAPKAALTRISNQKQVRKRHRGGGGQAQNYCRKEMADILNKKELRDNTLMVEGKPIYCL